MLCRYLLAGLLACATFVVHADDAVQADEARARASVQVLLKHEVYERLESTDGVAQLTIGKNFFNATFESQQDVVRAAFEYLRSQDPTIEKLTLIDKRGQRAGEFSANRLALESP